MKLLLALSTILLSTLLMMPAAHAESYSDAQDRLMKEADYEAPKGELFNEESYFQGQTSYNDYVNIIVINKAAKGPGAQTLRLYTNRQLMLTTPVSTGVENIEYISRWNSIVRRWTGKKGTTQSHWRHTTRGFYTIKRVEGADYHSGENKFHMPYAMFFNDERGLAVHQVPPDLGGGEAAGEAALGQRASSGCVRVHKNFIQQIHTAVEAADRGPMPVIDTKTGQAQLDARGQVVYKKAYKTLVIVEEK